MRSRTGACGECKYVICIVDIFRQGNILLISLISLIFPDYIVDAMYCLSEIKKSGEIFMQ